LDGSAARPEGRRIGDLIARMEAIGGRLGPMDARRHFHGTYLRTTRAVAEEIRRGGFLDPVWVERWDVEFAELYLKPFEAWDRGDPVPGPWTIAFETARDRPDLPGLRHVLFGINVHVNNDLPLALLAVISDQEFDDPEVVRRRAADHEHIDVVLSSRVGAEDRELEGRSLTDRLLAPLNRRASKRFLAEARAKVWRNARVLSIARRQGSEALDARIAELEGLCAARVADLVAPGQVVLKLARRGFGVLLSGA